MAKAITISPIKNQVYTCTYHFREIPKNYTQRTTLLLRISGEAWKCEDVTLLDLVYQILTR